MKKLTFSSPSVKPSFIWVFAAACYCFFIALLSYWYPYTIDEESLTPRTFGEVFSMMHLTYAFVTPRIFALVGTFILYLGKWSFVLLNPAVQLLNLFLIFYLVYLRRPDFSSFKDLSAAVIIMVLSVFAVAQPDNTLFWLGGAVNYSWPFAVFLSALILLRKTIRGEFIFKDSWKVCALMFLFGFLAGMTSENNGPMLLILFTLGAFYCAAKKINVPSGHYFVLAGLCGGLLFLFFSGANVVRSSLLSYRFFEHASLSQKLFWHFAEADDYLHITFCLPLLMIFGFALSLWQRGAGELKKPYARLFLAAFVISWTLFGALAFASAPPRALYSASAMNNVSLIFFLAYLRETYAAPFTRMTAVFMLCCAFVLAVPFAFPYYNLHCQALFRAQLISQANARGAREVFLPAFKTIRGLTENYNISFYDPLKNRDPKAAAKIFHTEAKINTDAAFNLAGTSPVL